MTRRAFVVGHPIAHSRSPLIHGHWLDAYGIDGSYERIDVAPEDFADFLRQFPASGFVGGNVTLPHKEAAFRLVDAASERARWIGAVNTLTVDETGRIHGDNTDAVGFMAHLEQSLGTSGPALLQGDAVVLGAGGAARAVIAGLIEHGARRVLVANRTAARAAAVAALDPERIVPVDWNALGDALPTVNLLVNTTSLSMTGSPPLEIDLNPLPDRAVVADIVYVPLETPLLEAARRRGLRTVDGLGMLLHQAVPGFAAWFGERPEVTGRLRELVIADLKR